MTPDPELDKLNATVAEYPDVIELRVRLVRLLAARGRHADAVVQAGEALRIAPGDPQLTALLAELGAAATTAPTERGFDWAQAESEVRDLVEPEYVGAPGANGRPGSAPAPRRAVRLADVAGMAEAKAQIERAFIGPLRNPELARAYGTGVGGGLLLYGPPGCGKTYIASAIAGELGAAFYPVGIPDIVEMATGATEQTLQQIFATAREHTPAVIFFDEIDAIGQKRSLLRGANVMRQLVTRLLTELDAARNDGVFVLAASNHPWDVDTALRRPGRLDRMLFVPPPDEPARAALIQSNFAGKPIAGIDLPAMVAATAGFSGADVAFVCRSAAQRALADSVATGRPRYIGMADVTAVLEEVTSSTGPWLAMARNVVEFANADGAFDELAAYLKGAGRRRR